jgi:hypothetical protein
MEEHAANDFLHDAIIDPEAEMIILLSKMIEEGIFEWDLTLEI